MTASDTELNQRMNVLAIQRNAALDQVVLCAGEIAALKETIIDLESQLAEMRDKKE